MKLTAGEAERVMLLANHRFPSGEVQAVELLLREEGLVVSLGFPKAFPHCPFSETGLRAEGQLPRERLGRGPRLVLGQCPWRWGASTRWLRLSSC